MEYMFLPLKRYAEFSGRSRRMEYWMFALFQFVLWCLIMVLFLAVAGSAMLSAARGNPAGIMAAGGGAMIIGALAFIIWLGLLIPGLAVGVRRLHDSNRSGWWLGGFIIVYVVSRVLAQSAGAGNALSGILAIVVLVYAIGLLVLMLLDGTKGPNKYGPDPKGQVDAQIFA